jgi:hypothetical protein
MHIFSCPRFPLPHSPVHSDAHTNTCPRAIPSPFEDRNPQGRVVAPFVASASSSSSSSLGATGSHSAVDPRDVHVSPFVTVVGFELMTLAGYGLYGLPPLTFTAGSARYAIPLPQLCVFGQAAAFGLQSPVAALQEGRTNIVTLVALDDTATAHPINRGIIQAAGFHVSLVADVSVPDADPDTRITAQLTGALLYFFFCVH